MASTFSGFYVAKSGIQAARANLQITGQNMTNVNTPGYTRQRVDTYAVGSSGNNMRYANKADLAIGEGVNCDGISQIRDPYLDVRYRVEHAKSGKTGTELDALNSLETVFDETKKSGIHTQFLDLVTQLQSLAGTPSNSSLENIVKNSSLLLTKAFNNAAAQISTIRKQQSDSFQNVAIAKANNLLKNISHLNTQIKSADVSSSPALELMDQRNAMIDELSQYANIEVSSKMVPVGAGREVAELNINLISSNGNKFNLVSDSQYNQFDVVKDNAGAVTNPVTMTLKTAAGNDVLANDGVSKLANTDVTGGAFGGYLSILNEKGEFGTGKTTERGIGYYENVLDKLASEFAGLMNKANSTNVAQDNKPLFAASDGASTINAGNISLSKEWNQATGPYLTVSKQDPITGVTSSTPGDNILSIIKQFSQEKTYTTDPNNAATGNTLFTSSVSAFMSKISDTLALQVQDDTRQDETYSSTLSEIETQRTSISSVDVNEEGINLIMYNQSLTASSRFMTTMDEAMDTIINNMGRVGR
jgi:flagellar hook-associated protein 1 FlgK